MRRRLGSAGLSSGQVFILIFGFLLASALIFFFGFLVGQRRSEWLMAKEERVVRRDMPAQPTPGKEDPRGVDVAFYEQMKEKAYRRLQGTPAGAPPTTGPQALGIPATLPRMAQASTPAAPTATPARLSKPTAAPQAKRGEDPAGRDDWADAGWTVQVNATTNPQQANDLARSLKAKGYDAYTVQAPLRGQTWYRVRVGRYSNRERAAEMEARLKAREGMENAYVTAQ